MENKTDEKEIRYCSFCGKEENDVDTLVQGPDVYICKKCVKLCYDLILDNEEEEEKEAEIILPTPREIKNHLDEHVVGQSDAKKYLSVGVYNHYKRVLSKTSKDNVNIQKSNILLIGPTGSGKTMLVDTLAKILKVPYVVADATGFTEAGYVGDDITSMLTRLYQNADGDIEKVQKGIIYIDEIDKKRKLYGTNSRDISGEGVQQALLKMMEGNIYDIPVNNPREKSLVEKKVQIDTKNILFICGGAFVGLTDIIERRVSPKQSIGISDESDNDKNEVNIAQMKKDGKNILSLIETEDLVEFGLIPEFLGRVPTIATLDELKEKDLVAILSQPKDSLLNQYKELFRKDNHNLIIEDEALNTIAKIAISKKIGARGLRAIMEKVLIDLQYTVPDYKYTEGEKDIIVTDELIREKIKFKEKKADK